MKLRKLALIGLTLFWLWGCSFVCFHAPEDYDMCWAHCYNGKCTR